MIHEAAHWADNAWQGTVSVTENVRLAKDTFRVRFDCPEIARRIVPGQFLMLRLAGINDPLLGRPLALYDTVLNDAGEPTGIDIVYLVIGKQTRLLSTYRPGQPLEVWGPLGNGFTPSAARHVIFVAGGIGQTPFLALGREYRGLRKYGDGSRPTHTTDKVTLCYGARTRDYLAGLADFEGAGLDVRLSTDDGSAGYHGLVTEVLKQVLAEQEDDSRHVACCGPEPMMAAVADICADAGVSCEVSLETPMACGIGICFSCVARVKTGEESWDFRRTCVEGPVFDGQQILF